MYYDYDPCYDCDCPENYDHTVDESFDTFYIASILDQNGLSWMTRIIHSLKYSQSQSHLLSFAEACDASMLSNIGRDHGWSWVDAQIILIQGIKFRLSLFPQQLPIDVEPF